MSHLPRIEKRLLVPRRVRRIRDGFSWIDRRFVREGVIDRLSKEEILLYLFLVCVADAEGLSFYSDTRIVRTLQIPPADLLRARQGLVEHELVAYEAPLYQVLDLPGPAPEPREEGPVAVADLLRRIVGTKPKGGV
jgi:hypothetical protein